MRATTFIFFGLTRSMACAAEVLHPEAAGGRP